MTGAALTTPREVAKLSLHERRGLSLCVSGWTKPDNPPPNVIKDVRKVSRAIRKLHKDGFVKKHANDSYHLTEKGWQAREILRSLVGSCNTRAIL
jgi:hypothetical protein